MKQVVIHTDGGCEGNPGPGGWAAVLRYGDRAKEISGGEAATTNNRMELQAAISALSALKEPCQVEIHTDSEYLKDGITKWVPYWKRNGWRTAERKPVKNDDLWKALDALATQHQAQWHWLKGHAGHADNERCDMLAQQEMVKIKSHYSPAHLAAAMEQFRQARDPHKNQLGLDL